MSSIHRDLTDYVAEHGEPLTGPTRCSGCWERVAVASDRVNEYCEVCWARFAGFDLGKRAVIEEISAIVLDVIREAGLAEIVARRTAEHLVKNA